MCVLPCNLLATQNQNPAGRGFGFVLPPSYWQPVCIYRVPGSHRLLATQFRVLAHQVDGLGIVDNVTMSQVRRVLYGKYIKNDVITLGPMS